MTPGPTETSSAGRKKAADQALLLPALPGVLLCLLGTTLPLGQGVRGAARVRVVEGRRQGSQTHRRADATHPTGTVEMGSSVLHLKIETKCPGASLL